MKRSLKQVKAKVRAVGTRVMEGVDGLVKMDRIHHEPRRTQLKDSTPRSRHQNLDQDKKILVT